VLPLEIPVESYAQDFPKRRLSSTEGPWTIVAFALYGLSKLGFNAAAIRCLDPAVVGDINSLLSFHAILLVFTAQPLASVVNRYIPEHIAEKDGLAVRSLFLRSILLLCAILTVLTLVVGYGAWSHGGHGSTHSLLGNRLMPMTIPYLWAYGMYFLCKMIYYGYQRITDYCIAEIMGSASFFFMLVLAIHSGSATAFVIPWIAHPIVFCSCFVWHFRRELRAGWKRQIDRGRRNAYLRYGFNWLTASASGLGAYHLSILFTKMLQADAAAVGYYSVALSLLTPLNLLPTSVSMVLFPRITSNYARGEDALNSGLIKKATANLLLPLGVCTVVICGMATEILGSMTIPTTRVNILAFQLVAAGLTVALISSPSGSFLSATAYAGTASVIGVSTLALGVAVWIWAVPLWGNVGTAAGYATLMCARGAANVLISNRVREWLPTFSFRGYALPVLVGVSATIAYPPWGIVTRLVLVVFVALAVILVLVRELSDMTKALVLLLPSRRARS